MSRDSFTLNAPDTAQVMPPTPAKSDLLAAFTAACHTTTDLKDLLRSGQSLLAACQVTAPGITEEALIAWLAAPITSQLDAAVAAGQITAAQEADGLATLHTQLSALITGRGRVTK